VTTHIPLDPGIVESLEPIEGTDTRRYSISPFAIPQAADIEAAGPGLVRSIRFHYLDSEAAGMGIRAVPLDEQVDPQVDLLFTDATGKVIAVQCRSPADASALEHVAGRMEARARKENAIAQRLSLLMTARILKVWADRFAGLERTSRTAVQQEPEVAKMLVTKMFDQGELVIELAQPFVPDPETAKLTQTGRWTALIHKGGVSWFSGGSLVDPSTRKTRLFDSKEAAFKAAVEFAMSCGLREL
jgi:hypothetical protein